MQNSTYDFDKSFLNKYFSPLELKLDDAAVLILPQLQARVMTSTCAGKQGFSFGWINHNFIASKKILEQFNPYGGEERLWFGPEGGQFSFFFAKDKTFDIANWQVPKSIDTEPFSLLSHTDTEAVFQKAFQLINYSGTKFNFNVNRKIKLLDMNFITEKLGIACKDYKAVAYESSNSVTNTGNAKWDKKSGKISIWMLGMLNPSPKVTVIIPVKSGNENEIGKAVNDNYFGKISSDRLKVKNNTVFFKADGKSRGKIGIPPLRTARYMGSYDAQNNFLSILECELPENELEYVNSAWEIQDKPYSGDAFNSYNDGPLEDGSQMGPFYELETSSPALSLLPNQTYTHVQRTYHLQANKEQLDKISKKVFKIGLNEIEQVF